MRDGVFVDEPDENGKITRKFNQSRLHSNLKAVLDYHEKNDDLLKEKGRFELFTKEHSKEKMRITKQALDKALSDKEKRSEEQIESMKESLAWLPVDVGNIDLSSRHKYPSFIQSYIKEIDSITNDLENKIKGGRFTDAEKSKMRKEAQEEKDRKKTVVQEKIQEARDKIQDKIEKKQKEIENKKEKEKKVSK